MERWELFWQRSIAVFMMDRWELFWQHLSFCHSHPVVVHLLLRELVILSNKFQLCSFEYISPGTMPWQPFEAWAGVCQVYPTIYQRLVLEALAAAGQRNIFKQHWWFFLSFGCNIWPRYLVQKMDKVGCYGEEDWLCRGLVVVFSVPENCEKKLLHNRTRLLPFVKQVNIVSHADKSLPSKKK